MKGTGLDVARGQDWLGQGLEWGGDGVCVPTYMLVMYSRSYPCKGLNRIAVIQLYSNK